MKHIAETIRCIVLWQTPTLSFSKIKLGMIYQFTPKLSPDCHAEQSEASLYRFFADAQNDK